MARVLWIVCGSVAALSAIAGIATLKPGKSLSEERLAARKEGLALTFDDLKETLPPVTPAENAAQGMERALAIFDRTYVADFKASDRVIDGTASRADRAAVLRLAPRLITSFTKWREASALPKVDFGARTSAWSSDPYTSSRAGYALKHMVAAVAIGRLPNKDLVAVARLSALLRTLPGEVGQTVGLQTGLRCLAVATRMGMGREVERALGPPTSVRFFLRPCLPRLLDAIRLRESYLKAADVQKRLEYGRPHAEADAIHGWRAIWSRLPSDSHDYATAATLLDRKVPPLNALEEIDFPYMCSACAMHLLPADPAADLRRFARFESLRLKARAR